MGRHALCWRMGVGALQKTLLYRALEVQGSTNPQYVRQIMLKLEQSLDLPCKFVHARPFLLLMGSSCPAPLQADHVHSDAL